MYFLNKTKLRAQNEYIQNNPDLPRILSLWNLLEHKYIQQTAEIIPLVLPSIKINKKIGVPMLDRPLFTRANISSLGNLEGWE
jgi:hypothetical protein